MVFSSIPVYLDPPNWQQQLNNHHHQPKGGGGNGIDISQLPLTPPPLPMGGGTGAIRANSMAERARMAKIPQPEATLKCPRCDSTNTKFCYFNNYSFSQPRHFCKSCRRYWTRGGALRNVPVGGGCRRNKRSKGSSSSRSNKSPAVTADQGEATAGASSSSAVLLSSSSHCSTTDHIISHHMTNPQQQFPILPPLNHLNDYNFGAIQANGNIDIGFQVANCTSNSGSIFSSGLIEQWKLQQFPFYSNGLDQATGLYSFDQSESVEPQSLSNIGQLRSKPATLDAGVSTQLENVKMEENNQRFNLSRNFWGINNSANELYNWGTNNNAWTDLPGFTSSTTHLL